MEIEDACSDEESETSYFNFFYGDNAVKEFDTKGVKNPAIIKLHKALLGAENTYYDTMVSGFIVSGETVNYHSHDTIY